MLRIHEATPEQTRLIVLMAVLNAYLLLALISYPLLKRQIKPNGVYGLRTSATRSNEKVWYEANARIARDMLIFAAVGAAATFSLYFWPAASELFDVATITILTAGVVLLSWRGARIARRLLDEQHE